MFSLGKLESKAAIFVHDEEGKGETKSWYEDEDVIATYSLNALKDFIKETEFSTLFVDYKILGENTDTRSELNKLITTSKILEMFMCENPNEQDRKSINECHVHVQTSDAIANKVKLLKKLNA